MIYSLIKNYNIVTKRFEVQHCHDFGQPIN